MSKVSKFCLMYMMQCSGIMFALFLLSVHIHLQSQVRSEDSVPSNAFYRVFFRSHTNPSFGGLTRTRAQFSN